MFQYILCENDNIIAFIDEHGQPQHMEQNFTLRVKSHQIEGIDVRGKQKKLSTLVYLKGGLFEGGFI